MEVEYRRETVRSFEEVCSRVKEVVEKNGFAVVAEIDSSGIMRSKGFNYPNLRIYDICNAKYAYTLLSVTNKFEVIIPCHLAIKKAGNKTEIAAGIPTPITSLLNLDDESKATVDEVIKTLKTIVDQLAETGDSKAY